MTPPRLTAGLIFEEKCRLQWDLSRGGTTMSRHSIQALATVILAAAFLATGVSGQGGIDTNDTRLLSDPAISGDRLAFAYGGDLWTADLDGKNVRRLTSDEGLEFSPAFSPDGKLIAFSGQYDGNTDVFVVPAEGGIPKRLTWHPGPDTVQGFTPDGKSIAYFSDESGEYELCV